MSNTGVMTQPLRPRQRTWTPIVLTQLVVVLAVLVSGVAGAGVLRGRADGGGKDVLQVVSAVGANAVAQETFRSTFEMRITGSGLDITSTGEALYDNVRKVSSGSVEAPVIGRLEFVSVGDTGYLKLPGGRADAAGKHWVSFTSPQGASAVGAQDPLAFLKLLGDPDQVRTVGDEEVNGVQTSHYAVELDPERLLAEIAKNPSAPAIPAGALDQFEDASIDLWVDEQNLPRRMRMEFSVQKVKASFRFDFLDFGGSVDVDVPAADDVRRVTNVAELGPLLQSLGTG